MLSRVNEQLMQRMTTRNNDNVRAIPRSDALCYLSANIYACEVHGGAVFLDLDSLQYSALDAQCLPVLRRTISNWRRNATLSWPDEPDASSETALLEALRAKGFLRTDVPDRAYFSDTPRPTTACTPNWNLRPSMGISILMFLEIAWVYTRTIVFLRSRRLRSLLKKLSTTAVGTPTPDSASPQALQLLITQFAMLRVWFYTARDACLLDSLTMASVLRRHNIDARLHIGVAVMPFSAHAWIQVGSCVLDDTVEHVCGYTPILVL